MILDIGCGLNPKGDVNIDNNRSIPKQKRVPDFFLADAENLPFRGKCFSLAHASHIIEHVSNPIKALREWNRVARIVEIYTPSPYSPDQTKTHIYTWNLNTFKNILSLVFKNVNVDYSSMPFIRGRLISRFPFSLIPIALAKLGFRKELKAICWD